MEGQPFSRDIRKVAFILLPRFSMIALVSALEPVRVANRYRPDRFMWTFVSSDGEPVSASNDIPVSATERLSAMSDADLAIICSSWDHERHLERGVLNPLRAIARRGTVIAGLDTGPFVMAEAGLLDGRRATVHWESIPAFRETYPDVETTTSLYEIDRSRITCSGGAASMDMMLEIIARSCDRELAVTVADQLVHPRFATETGVKRAFGSHLGITNPRLALIVEAMELNMEDPLANEELADVGGMSVRHMERLFRSDLGVPPRLFYQQVRLDNAQRLLRFSGMSVLDVAVLCGFRSNAHFTRSYRNRFGVPPSHHGRSRRSLYETS